MNLSTKILGVGAIFQDNLLTIPHYPGEDSKLRASSSTSRIGGNLVNLLRVLSDAPQAPHLYVCAAVGSKESTDHIYNDLHSARINPIFCYRPRCTGIPTATVLLSRETGSRTIISHHPSGFRALTKEDILWGLEVVGPLTWMHAEVRDNVEALSGALEYLWDLRESGYSPIVSLDYEKPPKPEDGWRGLNRLAKFAKIVFIARSYAMKAAKVMQWFKEDEDEDLSLVGTMGQMLVEAGMGENTVGYLTMGEKGCIVFSSKKSIFKGTGRECTPGIWYVKLPAESVEAGKVVESVGAGDAFQAGVLWAVMNDMKRGKQVDWVKCGKIGAAVAARKVQREGFSRIWEDMELKD